MPVIRRREIALAVLLAGIRTASSAELPPEECLVRLREARIYEMRGDKPKALEKLLQAEREYPKEILPLLARLEFYRRHGPGEAAMTETKGVLRKRLADPDAALPFHHLKLVVEDSGATTDELTLMRQAVEARLARSPENPRLLDALALLQERLEEPEAARETLGRLLPLVASPDIVWRCIELDMKLDRWDQVVSLFRKLRTEYKDDSLWARWQLGRSLARAGRYEEASREIAPLLERTMLRPFVIGEILLPAAWALRDQGKDADAEKIFRRVLEMEPGNAEARGVVLHLYATEDEKKAHSAVLDERWRSENNPFQLMAEGTSRLAAGDAASAFELLRRAADGMPDSHVAWFNLGVAAIRLERWEDVVSATRRALEIKEDQPGGHMNLGLALAKLNRIPEAIAEYERALVLDPTLPDAHRNLAFCYGKLGDGARAEKHRKLAGDAP